MLKLFFAISGLFFLIQSYSSSAQDKEFEYLTDTALFPADFFDQTDPLEITLAFDIKRYMKEKSDEEYLPP